MRLFLIATIFSFSFVSHASHLLGGNISWTCAGSNQYIFTLDLYKDCALNAATFAPTQTLNGPNGTFTVNLVSITDMVLPCDGPGGCSAVTPNGTELWRYVSSTPVTLTGTPPPTGWEFFYSSCCRNPSITNGPTGTIHLRAKMYNSGTGCYSSSYYRSNPVIQISSANQSLSSMAYPASGSDSLYYRFAHPHTASNTPGTFAAGYSYHSPFPNPNTNPANGPVSIDGATGLIQLNVVSAVTGLYNYTTAVEQWKGGVLVSEIFRDMAVSLGGGSGNNAPVVVVDTSLYPQVHFDGVRYSIDAQPGDTLSFRIIGQDADFNSSSTSFQQITFDAKGLALDTTWGASNSFVNKASFTPVFPQTNFTVVLKNEVQFDWVIDNEHVAGPISRYTFNMRFADDYCGAVGVANNTLIVNVRPGFRILNDTLRICKGDSAGIQGFTLSGKYKWSPLSGLSNDSIASPQASPSVSQYYYLQDPQNPLNKDSVYVEVVPRSYFNLTFSNGQLTITDSAQTATRVWYYNGIPFNYPYDTLTPFGLGNYYVVAKSGACEYTSDTVSITSGTSFSVSAPGNGGYSGTPTLITEALGVTFQVNQNVNVSWVSIPGISDVYGKTGGYNLNLKVYDKTQTEIFNTDVTIARPIDDVLKIGTNLNLMANQDYTIVVSGDTGYVFSLYDNMALPATPQNVGFTVKALLGGNAGQFPTTPVTYALPISMGIDKTVSLDELSENYWSIYPNPAKEQIQITGVYGAQTIELLDVNGKLVKGISLEKDQREVNLNRGDLPSGLYFVKVQFDNTTAVKKVLFQ